MSKNLPTVGLLLAYILMPSLSPADPSTYSDRSINADWRFLRGNAVSAEQVGFDDSTWRLINLPHDWSIEDLPPHDQDSLVAEIPLVPGSWRFSQGDNQLWSARDFDDEGWSTISLPESQGAKVEIAEGELGWYRRHFTILASDIGKAVFINLGIIPNQDWIFIDGKRLEESKSDYWSNFAIKSRDIQLPSDLCQPGDHVIAVRIKRTGPDGGFIDAIGQITQPSPCDPLRSNGNISTGYAVGGTGWYRKHFTLPADDALKHVRVVFDGSYMETTVWLNGQRLGNNVYGYSPFGFDLTSYLNPSGKENVLVVKVDNLGANSRWYSGSGLYRPVHLEFGGVSRMALWGLSVTTPEVSAEKARVAVRIEMEPSDSNPKTSAHLRILDSADQVVSDTTIQPNIAVAGGHADFSLDLPNAKLWSIDNPYLYRAEVSLLVDGKVSDVKSSTFGIRSLAWSADTGFLLNGKEIKLKGGCIHHDFGPLGSASFPQAEYRRISILKNAGYNAIRCSHNMPSTAFLDSCDRQGMLILDEAFDMWNVPKNPMDYSRFFKEWSQRDVQAMVRRDRNHPCIIMWSIGNEIPERFEADGTATAKRLVGLFHSLDPTRPVTAAFNGITDQADNFLNTLDISGYNYCPDSFEHDHQRIKNRVMFTTESYPKDSFTYWQQVQQHPYVIGDFVWTAWDYRGESGIGHTVRDGAKSSYLLPWPYANAFCGDFDVCGFLKPQGFYHQVLWDARKMAILVDDLPPGEHSTPDMWGWRDELPCWTWPGTEGKSRTVRVYAKGDEVTLTLNGKDFGTEKINPEFIASFSVPYAPGTLTAKVIKDGQITAQDSLETTDAPVAFRLSIDRKTMPADLESLAFITVEAVDEKNRVVPYGNQETAISITGPASLAGFGNGDPKNVGSVQSLVQSLWRGRSLLVIRSTGKSGRVEVVATGSGLKPAGVSMGFQ